MVLMAMEDFVLGSDEDRPDAQPLHAVLVDAVAVDASEVTEAGFAA